jgi:FkbM family methyltransferase
MAVAGCSFMKDMVRRLARSGGLYVSRYPPPATLAFHLKHLTRRLEINCVLDVGAHEGGYARLLRREVGFGGEIVSFEPAAASFAALRSALAGDRRWRGHGYALGRSPGWATLSVFAESELNTFLAPSGYGVERFPTMASPLPAQTVEVRRLGDVFDEVTAHVPEPRALLKVDTQGYDLEVIEGAAEVLCRVAALQVELPVKHVYEGVPGLAVTLERLDELGFEVTGMFPVTRDRDLLRVVEFDCVLRRRPKGGAAP